MTYDEDELIKKTYKDFKMQTFELAYKVQTKRKANEYAIFSNHFKDVPQIYVQNYRYIKLKNTPVRTWSAYTELIEIGAFSVPQL